MFDTINKVSNMLNDVDNASVFKYIPAEYLKYYNKFSKTYGYDDYIDEFGWDPSYGVSKSVWNSWHAPSSLTLMTCHSCREKDYEHNMFPVKGLNQDTLFICPDCISSANNINWCQICGEPFVVRENENPLEASLCYDCKEGASNNEKDQRAV